MDTFLTFIFVTDIGFDLNEYFQVTRDERVGTSTTPTGLNTIFSRYSFLFKMSHSRCIPSKLRKNFLYKRLRLLSNSCRHRHCTLRRQIWKIQNSSLTFNRNRLARKGDVESLRKGPKRVFWKHLLWSVPRSTIILV